MPNSSIEIFSAISEFIAARQGEFELIPDAREKDLESVAKFVSGKLAAGDTAQLTFVCTHNSRRSQLSQIWAQISAYVYGLSPVETFSGGTEATALNERAVACLRRSGLEIEIEEGSSSKNPRYVARYSDSAPAMVCFSKVYDETPNPTSGYCAVMTCSEADEACPVVMGCELRAPIRYEDPKVSDGTAEESAVYEERSRQICREMLYLMSRVNG